MGYTLEEKTFIANNRPKIEIEKIEFMPYCMDDDDFLPDPDSCIATKEAVEAIDEGEPVDAINIVITMVDHGADYEQKLVGLDGFCQLMSGVGDYISEDGLACYLPAVADKDGRFSVCFPFLIAKSEINQWYEEHDEEDYVTAGEKFLAASEPFFNLVNLTVCNQFVMEKIGTVSGVIKGDVLSEGDIKREHISYGLTPESLEERLETICDE